MSVAPGRSTSSARGRPHAARWTLIGAIALVAAWEALVRALDVRPYILRPPSAIVSTFADTPTFFLGDVVDTAGHLAAGLAISVVVSSVLGAAMASSRRLEHAAAPLLVLVLVTPWVAYITSIVVWVGRGTPAIVFLVAFVTVPAFVYAVVGGMRGADPAARELFASVDASRWEVAWRLRLPSALPGVLTAARFNVGLGLGAAYFAEGATSNTQGNGLGETGKRAASA